MAKAIQNQDPIFPVQENLALRRAAKALVDLQKKITKLHFEVAEQIDALKAVVPPKRLPGFLATECAVPTDLVTTYIGMAQELGESREILQKHGVPVSVLKDLVAADLPSRNATLLRISSGVTVNPGQTAAHSQDLRNSSLSPQERIIAGRRRVLRRLAGHTILRPRMEAFELSVLRFSQELHDFYQSAAISIRPQFKFHRSYLSKDPARQARFQSLSVTAGSVLDEFKRLYGDRHPVPAAWEQLARRRPNAVRLGMAYESLRRFSEGSFLRDGEFLFGRPGTTGIRLEMWAALQYLSSARITFPGEIHLELPRRRPRALELCAGIGGQALGLERAGFEFEALYEKADFAAAALLANRPGWKVSHSDLTDDLEKTFTEFEGEIDLISGGLPCQPYSGRGKGRGKYDERDLFPAAVEIVGIVKPKAFFFENVDGFNRLRHSSHRADIYQGFRHHGYDVQKIEVNAKDFGLAQDRDRLLIVGLRKDVAHRFRIDVPRHIGRATLTSSIPDLLFPYRTEPAGRSSIERTEKQVMYDAWSDWWLDRYGSKTAPTVTKGGQSKEYSGSWTDRGFDGNGLSAKPVSPDDLPDVYHLPKLTIAILKRLQGLPDDWVLKGRPDTLAQQLANAFPPQVAMAVGYALTHAITGEKPPPFRAWPPSRRMPKLNASKHCNPKEEDRFPFD